MLLARLEVAELHRMALRSALAFGSWRGQSKADGRRIAAIMKGASGKVGTGIIL